MKHCSSLEEPRLSQTHHKNDKQPDHKKTNMLFIINELCFIFAVIFTAYASFINSQSKTNKVAGAVPFFWEGSSVDDFYKGDLNILMNKIGHSSVSLVMYYAAWDADSKDARLIFEQVSQFYGQEVYFASVNCWHPGSQCRTTFKNIPRYPQMVAYKGPLNAVDYLGPITLNDLIKFMDSVMNPLVRVNTVSDIWKLRFKHDAVFLGCLKMDGLRSSRGYNLLYKLGWKMSGRDHTRKLIFTVLTHDRINPALGINTTPSFLLYTWNKKIEYTGEMHFDEIMKWIKSQLNNQLITSDLSGAEDSTSSEEASSRVIVTLFAPPSPLYLYSPYYHMLRRVAMKFNGCQMKDESGTTIREPGLDLSFYNHLYSGHNVYSLYEQDLIRSIIEENELCLRNRHVYSIDSYSVSRDINTVWTNTSSFCQKSCSLNELSFSQHQTFIDKTFQQRYWRRTCRLNRYIYSSIESHHLSHSLNLLQAQYEDSVIKPNLTACHVNKTVLFAFITPQENPQIAQVLGYRLTPLVQPSLYLFNQDIVIKLDDKLSERSIGDVLFKFLRGDHVKRYIRRSVRTYVPEQSVSVSLLELNSANFHSVIFNNSKTVIVLFYSNSCGWCSKVSQTLLRLSHTMRTLSDLIIFSRINMDFNDLPFYLQVSRYPTIIIFPSQRKSESRVYPAKKSWSLHTITQFVLSNLEPKQRVLAMISACSKWPISWSTEGEECIRDVRVGLIQLISATLRKWRTSVSSRRKYFEMLTFFKKCHLHLARVNNITDTILSLMPHVIL